MTVSLLASSSARALPSAEIARTTHLGLVWYPTVDLRYFWTVSVVKVSCSNSEYFHPSTELFIPLDFDLFQVSVRKFPLVKYSFVFLISLGSFKTVKCAESNRIRFKMLEKEGATIVAFPRLRLRNFTI